jgi:hypothetical protein
MPVDTTPCIANIGPSERRKRLWVGLTGFGLGIVIAIVLIGMDAPRLWRVPVFFPFWVGALGFVQARDKT